MKRKFGFNQVRKAPRIEKPLELPDVEIQEAPEATARAQHQSSMSQGRSSTAQRCRRCSSCPVRNRITETSALSVDSRHHPLPGNPSPPNGELLPCLRLV